MNVQQQTTQNVIIKSDIIDSIRQYLSGHGTDGSATYGEDRRTIVEGTRRRSRRSDFLDETQGTFNDQVDIGEETVSESGLYVVPPETIGIRRPTRDISGTNDNNYVFIHLVVMTIMKTTNIMSIQIVPLMVS